MKSGATGLASNARGMTTGHGHQDFEACQEASGALLSAAVCLHCSGGLSAAGGR